MGRLHLGDWLELYVCVILTIEFWYDKWWNDQERRRTRRAKKKPEFEYLTIGEGR